MVCRLFAGEGWIRSSGPHLSRSRLRSAINPVERLVEQGLMPSGVPRLDIGLDLLEKVGVRPLLGSEALGTERAHLAVDALYVNRPRLMVLDDDFFPNDDGGDFRAYSAFHKGVSDVKFGVNPGIARYPVEIDKGSHRPSCLATARRPRSQSQSPWHRLTSRSQAPRRRSMRASPGRRCGGDAPCASYAVPSPHPRRH